jgi:4-amino-4-deoxy-L-arabinose transferase-like glycosyltransferase
MSGRILTDQTFFTLHCFALVCLLEGLRRDKWKWFVGAGLLCGVAALIRPAGQFWPYIFLFLPFILPLPEAFTSRTRSLGRVAVVGLLALTMTLSWSARNYFVNGVFTFGNVGIQTVRNCVVAQIDSVRLGKRITDMRVIYDGEDGDHKLPPAESFDNMQKRVRTTIATYPGEFVSFYFRNVWANAIESNPYLARDFPILVDLGWSRIWEILKNINRVLFLVSILALVLLARDKQWSGFVILGIVFAYFTLVTGFSFWQGSRLHYPAELAWAVLIAYMWVRLRSFWRKQPLQMGGVRF